MDLAYAALTPPPLQYRDCPMWMGWLANAWDADRLFRPQCLACGWIYSPPNGLDWDA